MSMTENEALKVLKRDLEIQRENKALPDGIAAMEIAIQTLEEIQQYKELGTVEEILKVLNNQQTIIVTQHETVKQYRAIGTIEELQALKEKNVAKKVIRLSDNEYYDYKCPACGMPDKDCIGKRYCNCGQALET